MKGRFNMPAEKKLFRKDGITLMELMIVIALIGLIFGLGIYPVLSQLQLFKAERSEVALFDDANLVVYYITKDAMMAQGHNLTAATPSNTVTFEIVPETWDPSTEPRPDPAPTVVYTVGGSQLLRNGAVITNKLDSGTPPTFTIDPDNDPLNPQLHRLQCNISFQDPDNTSLTTTRAFEVMLRSRDTRY